MATITHDHTKANIHGHLEANIVNGSSVEYTSSADSPKKYIFIVQNRTLSCIFKQILTMRGNMLYRRHPEFYTRSTFALLCRTVLDDRNNQGSERKP